MALSTSASDVFGEPVNLGSTTIVPVAVVKLSGGGGSLKVVPVGFISEHEGVATFTPIELPESTMQLLHGDEEDRDDD